MTVFFGALKRILSNRLNWVFLCLFPLISFLTLTAMTGNDATPYVSRHINIAVADLDNSALSNTLANALEVRYNIVNINESEVSTVLSDQSVSWALVIKQGYEAEVLSKNTAAQTLEGFSLAPSDVSALGSRSAENITRSLMLLGTTDEAALSNWLSRSAIEIEQAEAPDSWEGLSQWLSMYGFLSMFAAFFIVKTLMEDKLRGMPERVGVLPVSPRSYLIQGSLAAFLSAEIAVLLTMVSLSLNVGDLIVNMHLLFAVLTLYNLFGVSLMLSIMSITKSFGAVSIGFTMFTTLNGMLGGLFWPLELVPDVMKRVAWFTPGYWFGQGIRGVQAPNFESFIMPLLFLLGFSVVAMLLGGIKSVQRMEE